MRRRFLLAVCAACGAALPTQAQELSCPTPAKYQIGETQPADVHSPQPYHAGTQEGDVVWSHTFQQDGATFVRVRISEDSDLGTGDRIIIRDAEDTIVRTYRGKSLVGRWTRSAFGDTLTVELVSGPRGGGAGVFIDEIAWGTQPLFEEAGQVAGGNLTSICSATDQSRIRLADPVARLSWIDDCGGVFVCSGWLFSPSGHIMTNAHCANSASEAESLEAWFNWITSSCDRNSEPNPDVYEGNTTLFSVNCNLDYTTFIVHDRTKGNPADVYGFLPIDSSNPRNGSEIWVPQHPGGNRKQISENCSVVTNQVGGFNFCSDPPSCPPVFGSPSGFVDLSFDCEIQGGSSGSPILNTDNFVIGIAHATTGSVNIGVRMRNIHTDIPNFPFAINFPAPDSINEGEPFQFNVTGTFLSGPTFEVTSSTVWTISPEGAATVDGDGVFVGGPVDADTLVTVTGSYTANDVTVERSVRITVLDAPDSPGDIVSSFPPHGAIDARQTSQLDGSEPAGWDSVELTFDGNIDSLAPQDFAISQLGGVAAAPAVMDVQLIGPQTIRLVLSDHITAGAWTTFLHEPSGTSIRLGYLPADTSGDGTSSAADIISLVDHLNGVGDPLPEWSTDTDRTGVANGADIVRLIDLLNGASELDEWLNVSLPTP